MPKIPKIKPPNGNVKSESKKPDKSKDQSQKQADAQKSVKSDATGANTPTSVYLSVFTSNEVCAQDRKEVENACTPEKYSKEDEKNGKKKPKKGGLAGKLTTAAKKIDDIGKMSTKYVRDLDSTTAFSGNGWMDESCTGLWLTPIDTFDKNYRDGIDDLLKNIDNKRLSMLKDAVLELAALAAEKAKSVAFEKMVYLGLRSFAKALFGAATVETVAGPAIMTGWTITDILSTAKELAELCGPKGQAAYNAMMQIEDIAKKSKSIVDQFETDPHKSHADAMSLMAQLDSCVRARKCLLVAYKDTTPDGKKIDGEKLDKAMTQARHGNGCCPGQTGHHIIPNAMMKGVNCPSYKYRNAPTICVEGTKNGFSHGSHGKAHENLSKSVYEYKLSTGKDYLSYSDAKRLGIDAAMDAGALHCDPRCLAAQLDAHYGACDKENFKAAAGTGATIGAEDLRKAADAKEAKALRKAEAATKKITGMKKNRK